MEQIKSWDSLPCEPGRQELADEVGKKWDQIYSRFKQDLSELTAQMGGSEYLHVNIGPGGITDAELHLIL